MSHAPQVFSVDEDGEPSSESSRGKLLLIVSFPKLVCAIFEYIEAGRWKEGLEK